MVIGRFKSYKTKNLELMKRYINWLCSYGFRNGFINDKSDIIVSFLDENGTDIIDGITTVRIENKRLEQTNTTANYKDLK